jgi:hypothetical protein
MAEDEDFGYLVRRLELGQYEVTKWGLSQEPIAIYSVMKANGRWICSSPGCKRATKKCKHAQLVTQWLDTKPQHHEMPVRMIELP